jgi:V8-like Glu-specific endopeptidase
MTLIQLTKSGKNGSPILINPNHILTIESIEVLGGGVTEHQSRITLSSSPNHIVFVTEGMATIKKLIMK